MFCAPPGNSLIISFYFLSFSSSLLLPLFAGDIELLHLLLSSLRMWSPIPHGCQGRAATKPSWSPPPPLPSGGVRVNGGGGGECAVSPKMGALEGWPWEAASQRGGDPRRRWSAVRPVPMVGEMTVVSGGVAGCVGALLHPLLRRCGGNAFFFSHFHDYVSFLSSSFRSF